MTGLCVADAPDESCWFILQDVFLPCRLCFYVPVMTAESFLSELSYRKWSKDGYPLFLDLNILLKIQKSFLNQAVKCGVSKKRKGSYEAVRRSFDEWWWSCQTAHVLSMIGVFKGKSNRKHLNTVLKKLFWWCTFHCWGPNVFYSHRYKWCFEVILILKVLQFLCLHTTLTAK